MSHRPNAETAKPYPGVRVDANQIAHPSAVAGVPAPGVVFWSVVDFPFSAVLDTLLLPIDVPAAVHGIRNSDSSAREQEDWEE
jgi:uncharacterized protein YceK